MKEEIVASLARLPGLAQRRIIIWGAGSLAELTLTAVVESGAEVACFIDGTELRVGQRLQGLPIFGPDDLRVQCDAKTLILIASTWWREIGMNLLNRGFRHLQDFVCVQRRHCSVEWNRDVNDPEPVFVGQKTTRWERLLHYYPTGRPRHIGAFCSVAEGVYLAANHPTDFISTHTFTCIARHGIIAADRPGDFVRPNPPAVIGNDVWLGVNSILMPGINIGDGAIVAAGAVVTKDVPPYAIVAGVPAKLLRFRFDEHRISLLLALKWWTWSDLRLRRHVDDFRDPAKFFALAESLVTRAAGAP